VLRAGKFDLIQLGWLTEVPSADGFVARQLGSGSLDNQVGFSDERLDALVAAARGKKDAHARAEAYAAAEAHALAAAALIPVVQLAVGFDQGPHVRAATLDGSGTFDPAVTWLAPR
jgi:ABC-type oligopeptide transport system substrate-binding subunit